MGGAPLSAHAPCRDFLWRPAVDTAICRTWQTRSPAREETMSDSIHNLTAQDLALAFAAKRLSPVEATKAALARIETWEGRINAMYVVDAEGALRQAKESEARWAGGNPKGPLDGV